MGDNKGVLAVISGFSGAGKGTLISMLLSQYDNYALSVSATTRRPREGEKEGEHYFFKTREEFDKMIEIQKKHFEHCFVDYNVHTDFEGCSYNSLIDYDEEVAI